MHERARSGERRCEIHSGELSYVLSWTTCCLVCPRCTRSPRTICSKTLTYALTYSLALTRSLVYNRVVQTCLKSIKPFFIEDFIYIECAADDDRDDMAEAVQEQEQEQEQDWHQLDGSCDGSHLCQDCACCSRRALTLSFITTVCAIPCMLVKRADRMPPLLLLPRRSALLDELLDELRALSSNSRRVRTLRLCVSASAVSMPGRNTIH